LRILLAEDNAINQKVALSVLENLGYHAALANNGREAINAVQNAPFDVILMDVQMPGMDGLEATRHIRTTLPHALQPRIIAMTANAMQGDREECLAAGMDDYISKPFQIEQLVETLQRCRPLAIGKVSIETNIEATTKEASTQNGTSVTVVEKAVNENTEKGVDIPPTFDPTGLQRLRETLGKKADELLPILLDSFFEDAPQLITTARQAWEQNQMPNLRRATHTLKSNSLDFGAVALAEVARELEGKAKDGILDNVEMLLNCLDEELAHVKPELQQVRERMTNGGS
jgi:CheY-like chemotaxis protein/HPt (histidine-containing phosphotransfer) domain-containing protein